MTRAFPGAPVHTLLHEPGSIYPEFAGQDVRPSPLNRVGPVRRDHRAGLPLYAPAASATRVEADVTVVSSSGWAHGFRHTGRSVVYCYSPARWLYQTDTYLGGPARRSPKGVALLALRPALRRWDAAAARRHDRYLAISRVVRDRIRDTYGLDAAVVPAPHAMDAGAEREPVPELADWAGERYLLVVSRLLPYKNVGAVVEAVRGTSERLVVVGDGPLRRALVAGAPDTVRLVSGLTDAQVRWVYAHAGLLVAPSVEDYGLSPLEAAAFGVPALTLGAGGYLDTVVEGTTGLHVRAPEPALLRDGIARARAHPFDAGALRAHAETFTEPRFHERLRAEVDALGAAS
ncbi:glycosyltransferase family 4 protein [Phycicoccus sp. CMS6Z-2]|nr:glycosyltransferase family 4 protein [Phycicoccus flavus]